MDIQSILRTLTSFTKKPATTHPNREGAPSYFRSLKEQVLQVLSTSTLSDTFYVSRDQLTVETVEVLMEARKECPEFLARALVWARREGYLKLLPVLGLAILSGARKTKLFSQTFSRVVLTPDDLRTFTALVKSGKIDGRKGLGGIVKDEVKKWIENISEYHALKYGSANSKDMTLGDIIRLTHPKPANPTHEERFGWLVKGKSALRSRELNPQIVCLEDLKQTTDETAQISLIRQGRLPYEVVVPAISSTTTAIWTELLHQAPYMNLLRSLQTLTRHQVFEVDANVEYAVKRLTDAQAIAKAKVLPFRFFSAWQTYTQGDNPDSRIADALRCALELSFVNMPDFDEQSVTIAPDVSGSMNSQISEKSVSKCIDIAGIFCGALLKRIQGKATVLPFDTRVHTSHGISSRDDVMIIADKVRGYCGGGTAVGAPIEYLLDHQIKTDIFIGITDNEDWAYGRGHRCSGSFLDMWRRYKSQVAPNAKAFLLTIAPYRDVVAPQNEPDCHFIYGWSENVLRYIMSVIRTGENQVAEIEKMSLDDLNPVTDTLGRAEDAQIEET